MKKISLRGLRSRLAAKRPTLAGIRGSFGTIQSKNGLFSAGMIALVVAIVIVFNLAVGYLPSNLLEIDLSSSGIYTVTDTSVDYLAALDTDVELIVVAENGDVDSRITRFLDRYVALSDHLSMRTVDPVTSPSVLTDYETEQNTIVVRCEETGRQEIVYFDDILVMDYYSYMMYGYADYTEFDAEGQLTSAIDYVVSAVDHTVYTTTGHGEMELGSLVVEQLERSHFTTSSVNLTTDGGIPEDCDLLVINQPTSDLSVDELEMVRAYLAAGGQVSVILDSEQFEHPHLTELMEEYGLVEVDGYIADAENYYWYQNSGSYYIFFPELDTSTDAADGVAEDAYVMVGYDLVNGMISPVLGLTEGTPARDTITVTPFLTTSENGMAVVDEENITTGQYLIGVTASEEIAVEEDEDETSEATAEDEASAEDAAADETAADEAGAAETSSEETAADETSTDETSTDETSTDEAESEDTDSEDTDSEEEEEAETVTARLTVITADTLLDDTLNSNYSLANIQAFLNTVTAGFEDVENISIEPKSLSTTYNTINNAGMLGLIVVAVIPLGILIVGVVRWMRRRKL